MLVAASAHAQCDNQELKPGDTLRAKYVGQLAGQTGTFRCRNAQIRLIGPWSFSQFQAKCNGVLVQGSLHYYKDCRVASNGIYWTVEGTQWAVTGGSHDESRDRTIVRLKNGGYTSKVKIWRQ